MRLRGVSTLGEVVNFTLSDCPVILNDKTVVLLNRPNSPLLQAKSIARGLDNGSMYETDFVLDSKCNLIGYVVYEKGFKMYNIASKEVVPFPEDFKVIQNATLFTIPDIKCRRKVIKFCSNGITFSIHSLIVAEGNTGYVFSKNLKTIDLCSAKFATGLKKGSKEICYGDHLLDGEIVLHDFHPMVETENGYRELRLDEYDN